MSMLALCINPNCSEHFHRIDPEKSVELYESGVMLIKSTDGSIPPAEFALKALQQFVDDTPYGFAASMATKKMLAIEAELNQAADEGVSKPSEVEDNATEGPANDDDRKTVASASNGYYDSKDHYEHMKQQNALELKLQQATIRKINAEAEAIEISNYVNAKTSGFKSITTGN